MFDFVRKHNKIMQFLLFLLIFPSFVLFGIDGYNRFRQQGETVAKVDGQDIGQAEWDAAQKADADRLRAQMPTLDPKLLDSPEARYATLERLLRERVLKSAAVQSNLVVSDLRLARELQDNPSLKALRKPDGSLDMDRYKQLVGSQGMTPEMFEAQVRQDLQTRQVLTGLVSSGMVNAAVADVGLNAYFDTRELNVLQINTADFAAKQNPTDAELEQFYKEHTALFQAPEQADIEYLVLDLESLQKTVPVTDADLKTYYEQNAARLNGQEERRASHILIAVDKAASAAERAKAKAKATDLLAQLKQSPQRFAELAKLNSQDPGSAANGGDLDYFSRGAMVKPFEDAAFALKVGDLSEVVESEFGYHIIKLTDIKLPQARSFEAMKPELETAFRKQAAQTRFNDVGDVFLNGVFEQPDTFKALAERLQLVPRTARGLTRVPAAGTTGVLANPKFLNAIFSPESVEKKRNTQAIELAVGQLVSGRIVQYTPVRTLPLAEVKDKVRQQLNNQRGALLAKQKGQEELKTRQANPAAAVWPAALEVSREKRGSLPPAVVEAALRTDTAHLPTVLGVDLGERGYAVVRVNRQVPRASLSAEQTVQDRQQYAKWWATAEALAYYQLLQQRFKVQIKVPKPGPAVAPTGTEP